jgi:hypothetical protein
MHRRNKFNLEVGLQSRVDLRQKPNYRRKTLRFWIQYLRQTIINVYDARMFRNVNNVYSSYIDDRRVVRLEAVVSNSNSMLFDIPDQKAT